MAAAPGGGTGPPLLEGVLERLAVRREPVTARTELRPEKGRAGREAVVRQSFAGPRDRWRSRAPGRTEALVPADVTARADDALRAEAGVEHRIGAAAARRGNLDGLLGEGCVAVEAGTSRCRLALDHFDELARDARPHAFGVQDGLPIGQLNRMAGATVGRKQRSLDGREPLRWLALGRDGAAPMPLQEVLLSGRRARRLGAVAARAAAGQEREHQAHSEPPPRRRLHELPR